MLNGNECIYFPFLADTVFQFIMDPITVVVESTISEYIYLPKSDKMIAIFTSYLLSLFNSLSY